MMQAPTYNAALNEAQSVRHHSASPYANGRPHIGHIMEYIQADIWVRFQKMRGNDTHFVCAEDAHGVPSMIAAEKAGKTPQHVYR